LLAPDPQQRLLFLILMVGGQDVFCLRRLQPTTLESSCRKKLIAGTKSWSDKQLGNLCKLCTDFEHRVSQSQN